MGNKASSNMNNTTPNTISNGEIINEISSKTVNTMTNYGKDIETRNRMYKSELILVNEVQNVWNHAISDMINKSMDAKDYLEKYMNTNDDNEDYMERYMDVSKNVTGLMQNLKFTNVELISKGVFSLWTRVKWNKYYSEFQFKNSINCIQIRLNIKHIDIYYAILNGEITNLLDDRIIFDILDFLPREINDKNGYTLLLQDYKFKNMIKGRDIDRLKQIAFRCKVPVEAMYYILDIFESFQTDTKWTQYIEQKMHQQNKLELAQYIGFLNEQQTE